MTIAGHLPVRARLDRRWRNGGGVTREIAIFPENAGDGDFLWRASIATIDAAGPFSLWPGVDRLLMLLQGRLAITIEQTGEQHLAPGDPALAFAGETAVEAAPVGNPCIVFNIMTRRGGRHARLGPWIPGRISIARQILLLATEDGAVNLHGETLALDAHDALLLDAEDAAALNSDRPLVAAEFFAAT